MNAMTDKGSLLVSLSDNHNYAASPGLTPLRETHPLELVPIFTYSLRRKLAILECVYYSSSQVRCSILPASNLRLGKTTTNQNVYHT